MTLYPVAARATASGPDAFFNGRVGIDALAVAPRPSALRVHHLTCDGAQRDRPFTPLAIQDPTPAGDEAARCEPVSDADDEGAHAGRETRSA